MAKFVQTAVVSKENGSLVKFCKTAEELKEFDGREDVALVTRKDFKATEQYPTFDELTGKVKAVKPQAASTKPKRNVTALAGEYHVTDKFKVTEGDARNVFAEPMRDNNTFEAYAEATKDKSIDLPSSRNEGRSNKITGASYIRYALQRGWIAVGAKPAVEAKANETAAS